MIKLKINDSEHKISSLNLIHKEIGDFLYAGGIFTAYYNEPLTVIRIELLKIVGRYSEDYKAPVRIHPTVYQQIKRKGDTIIVTITDVKIKISLEIDLTQPWKSIPWNYKNEYNLNDEPVLPQIPEEKEGGYIFIGNRLWSRESFLKYFIPA